MFVTVLWTISIHHLPEDVLHVILTFVSKVISYNKRLIIKKYFAGTEFVKHIVIYNLKTEDHSNFNQKYNRQPQTEIIYEGLSDTCDDQIKYLLVSRS